MTPCVDQEWPRKFRCVALKLHLSWFMARLSVDNTLKICWRSVAYSSQAELEVKMFTHTVHESLEGPGGVFYAKRLSEKLLQAKRNAYCHFLLCH